MATALVMKVKTLTGELIHCEVLQTSTIADLKLDVMEKTGSDALFRLGAKGHPGYPTPAKTISELGLAVEGQEFYMAAVKRVSGLVQSARRVNLGQPGSAKHGLAAAHRKLDDISDALRGKAPARTPDQTAKERLNQLRLSKRFMDNEIGDVMMEKQEEAYIAQKKATDHQLVFEGSLELETAALTTSAECDAQLKLIQQKKALLKRQEKAADKLLLKAVVKKTKKPAAKVAGNRGSSLRQTSLASSSTKDVSFKDSGDDETSKAAP